MLRRVATLAERRLWVLLRDRRLAALKFRRQVPIGHHYIADFCCAALQLIVEADGSVHRQPAQIDHDENRDGYLAELGYRVLRFSNGEIMGDSETVLNSILRTAEEMRSPPSP